MNTNLRKNFFFKFMNNAIFEKTILNARKHRNIKLVTTEGRRNYLVPEPNFHTTKFFTENLSETEMSKTQMLMNIPVYLGLSILELSKTVMCEFWSDYLKPKYSESEKPYYMDADSFIVHVKTDDIYKEIAEDVGTRFDTSNLELFKLLSKRKNETKKLD